MSSFNVMNLALFRTILLLLYFGVEAESSSTCSLPGMPGRDGMPGQAGRDGRDGLSGPVGPPGGELDNFHYYCYVNQTMLMHAECTNETLPTIAANGAVGPMALLDHLVNRALLDPLVNQEPQAPQEERLTFAGGGQCAQILLELS